MGKVLDAKLAEGWEIVFEDDSHYVLAKSGEENRIILKPSHTHSEVIYHNDGTREYRIIKEEGSGLKDE